MGRSQLTIFVDKHLGLEYPVLAWLVDKAEIQNGGVMIYKTIKRNNQQRARRKSKEISNIDTKGRK